MLALHSYQCRYQHQHQHSGFPNITRERSTSSSPHNSRLLRFDVFHTIGYLDTFNRVFLFKLKIGAASGIPSYSPLGKVATINKKSSLTVITASVTLKKSNQMPCTVVNNSIKLCLLATWGVPFLQFSHSKIGTFTFPPTNFIAQWSAQACC